MTNARAGLVRRGRVWLFGDNINTDLIAPHRAMIASPEERLRLIFAANRPGWSGLVLPGDLIVAGHNFGAGSGRPAARLLVEIGIRGVVAESIAGLFLRNSINYGLPALDCPGISSLVAEGDELEVDYGAGKARNPVSGQEIAGAALPGKLLDIIAGGGVLEILTKQGYIARQPASPPATAAAH